MGDCLYMTIITLSTVGYGEVIPMNTATRIFASVLIIFGMGALIYFGSTVIAFWIDLDLKRVRRRKRMQDKIKNILPRPVAENDERKERSRIPTGCKSSIACPSPSLHRAPFFAGKHRTAAWLPDPNFGKRANSTLAGLCCFISSTECGMSVREALD